MVRAPYPARIAAGLLVTAVEETRKLPTLLITLPVTAVSETLQLAMRAQQGIAELAIKGDAALEMIFDHPCEEPEWARFDEDEAIEPPAATVVAIASAPSAETTAPTPARTDSAKTTEPESDSTPPSTVAAEPAPRADAGRFALYSSAPEEVIAAAEPDQRAPATGDVPDVVVATEYDSLTLAQLRAKLRTVGVDDLAQLLDYEKSTRNRAPFVTMIDNRITAAENKRTPSK